MVFFLFCYTHTFHASKISSETQLLKNPSLSTLGACKYICMRIMQTSGCWLYYHIYHIDRTWHIHHETNTFSCLYEHIHQSYETEHLSSI